MKIVKLLIPAYGIHVGVKTLSGLEAVACQRQTLPLGKRLYHLHAHAGDGLDIKFHRPLNAIEIVIETGVLGYKKRGGNPLQIKLPSEFLGKCIVDMTNRVLSLVNIQDGIIVLWDDEFHNDAPFVISRYSAVCGFVSSYNGVMYFSMKETAPEVARLDHPALGHLYCSDKETKGRHEESL